jgi:two-component system chemotaxis sensor kinase CheA
MSDIGDKHRETYREEAYELLGELEEALLELEENPDNEELVDRVFRAMHTIKGSGSMFGFDDIADFTHEVETVFDLVRNGLAPVSKELIDLTLTSRDYIREMLEASSGGTPVDKDRGEKIISDLKQTIPQEDEKVVSPVVEEETRASADHVTYRIIFKPPQDIFMMGTNPLFMLDDLHALGKCKVVAQMCNIPRLEDVNPEECYTYWDIILTTSEGINAIRDVFIFIEDDSHIKIDVIDESGAIDEEEDYKMLGEILLERRDITASDLTVALTDKGRLGDVLISSGVLNERQVEAALLEQALVKEARHERKARQETSTIRVASEKLDSLVDLVGELVTVQAHLTQVAGHRVDPELLGISEEVERLTAELHDNTMSIRMVPIGSTFSKFRRLVRDLSAELGRDVRLTTEGAETELDKTVIERLNDPMVHLIRNCIDHGIEPPAVREGAAKPSHGTVHLVARHSGANVLIQIKDDGKGLDTQSIMAKAIERGAIAPDAELSEMEIFNLITLPGFSTAEKITGVSGRGVGMDVVKRNIEALRGSLDISSKKGVGTTMTLRIPLTLAIIEGLLVKIGEGRFVFPLLSVEECVEITKKEVQSTHGRDIINVRGEIVPYIKLRKVFDINGSRPDIEQVVLVNSEGQRVGFVVDHVIGEHQTVIKSLGTAYRNVQGISGATILGDGAVALIVDVPKLIEGAEIEENHP